MHAWAVHPISVLELTRTPEMDGGGVVTGRSVTGRKLAQLLCGALKVGVFFSVVRVYSSRTWHRGTRKGNPKWYKLMTSACIQLSVQWQKERRQQRRPIQASEDADADGVRSEWGGG